MSDLDDLKSLLFGAEKQVLDSISERVQMPEARAADIAAVLAEAVRLSHVRDAELAESLKEPVGRVLRDSFHESPQEFGDALYPVMGPAIRKSITHTLKAFVQQINQTLEYSLTLKGLKWRLQAARAGVPFGAYVIQRSLLYRVEQAYLISRNNGLLMGHVHHDASHIKDSDAVSAMFTAIQDFVKESFSPDRSGRLETADMGEFTLWAVHGPHALLVCVIRGMPPADLRDELSAVLERLHFRYGEAIRHYSGDTNSVVGVEDELRRCLAFEAARPTEKKRRGPGWPLIIVLALVLAGSGWLGYRSIQEARQLDRLQATLDATPGYYVGRIERTNDGYRLHGLRDPLAASLDDIAARAGIPATELGSRLRPYRSLDDELRLARALQHLALPAGVSATRAGNILTLTGSAPADWLALAPQRIAALGDDWRVDATGLQLAGWPELQHLAAELDGARFYFVEDAEMANDSRERLAGYAEQLADLAGRAAAMDAGVSITVTGHTDGAGTLQFNRQLAAERSNLVAAALAAAGIAAAGIRQDTAIPRDAGGDVEPEQRRVSVSVELAAPAAAPQ